jgi:hypothetical protein
MRTVYFYLATALSRHGVPFEQTYEILFGRPPSDIGFPCRRTGGCVNAGLYCVKAGDCKHADQVAA